MEPSCIHVDEHGILEEDWPAAFARWIAEITGGPVPRFEGVEPGDEQILPDREQRELTRCRPGSTAAGFPDHTEGRAS